MLSKVQEAQRASQQRMFLEAYAELGHIGKAAELAGCTRHAVKYWRNNDEAFATAFDEAGEEAIDALEAEARRRAVDGTEEPVFQKGELVGHVRKYSDVLLMFLLNGNRPEKYKRNQPQRLEVVTVDAVDQEIRRLTAELARAESGAAAPPDSGPAGQAGGVGAARPGEART